MATIYAFNFEIFTGRPNSQSSEDAVIFPMSLFKILNTVKTRYVFFAVGYPKPCKEHLSRVRMEIFEVCQDESKRVLANKKILSDLDG